MYEDSRRDNTSAGQNPDVLVIVRATPARRLAAQKAN